MAKLLLFSVYDSKADAFAAPFTMRSKGEALRGWMDVCNDKTTQMYKYPEDFSLMEIGEFDELTGEISKPLAPMNLGLAASFKRYGHEEMDLSEVTNATIKRLEGAKI